MSLDGNCDKSGQTNLIVCMMLPVGVVLCMPGQYRVFPPLAAIIAARRRDMLATRRCRGSIGFLSIYPAELGGAHQDSGACCHTGDSTAQFILNMFYRRAVWRSCRLLHPGDIALLKEVKDYPSTARCGVIILLAVAPQICIEPPPAWIL